jgi:phage shock protein PspC (stress-responsive transcriptional regulator)
MNEMHGAAAAHLRLTRSTGDRWLTGVCGGLAEYTGVDPTIIRVAFAIVALAGGGGVAAYVLMWLLVPSADEAESRADRMVAKVRRDRG